jgi:ParB-like chromosome segregation protein Spo0J
VNLADKIVMRPISVLIPYARNARIHSDEQVAQIAASIREFGFTNPVLVDGEQGIIAGHGRVLAAYKLGMDLIPTIELAYLTAAQRQAYKITDNKLALNAGWDQEMLRLEMGELRELGFDLTLTGFDDIELGALFADKTAGLTDPDDTPPVPEHPVSQTGDLWLLGAKVTCPKCRKTSPLERAIRK